MALLGIIKYSVKLYWWRKKIIRKSLEVFNETQFIEIANNIAYLSKGSEFIALYGQVGTGKTTFARNFVKYFCGDKLKIPSPTFNLVFTYDTQFFKIWHFDLYRLDSSDEAWEIGLDDVYEKGIALIEWPEIIENFFPINRLIIKIEYTNTDPNFRIVNLEGYGTWEERILIYDKKK